eukprot:GFYU01015958.1.p1 GENE.GFYU01015958.1~~GFYU01015958.1.p1  ORF type:complete len:478 (+),score=158.09 GFYU01015958.1:118-1551(+)
MRRAKELLRGHLSQKRRYTGAWDDRYVVLDTKALNVFEKESDSVKETPKSDTARPAKLCLVMVNCTLRKVDEAEHSILVISSGGHEYFFRTEDKHLRDTFLQTMTDRISGVVSNDSSDTDGSDKDIALSPRLVKRHTLPHLPTSKTPKMSNMCMTMDKHSLLLSVWNIGLMAFFVGGNPDMLVAYCSIVAPALIALRVWAQKHCGHDWQFACLDLSYVVNALVIAQHWMFPANQELLQVIFALSVGPLAWSLLTFRSQVAVNSIDLSTNSFLHVIPLVLVWAIRWNAAGTSETATASDLLFWGATVGSGVFAVQQFVRMMIAECVYGMQMERAPIVNAAFNDFFVNVESVTATVSRALGRRVQGATGQAKTANTDACKSMNGCVLFTICNVFGAKLRLAALGGVCTVGAFASMLTSVVMYNSFLLHTMFVVGILGVATANAGVFYLATFKRHFMQEMTAANASKRWSPPQRAASMMA